MSANKPDDNSLPAGVYERLLDEGLAELLRAQPELIPAFSKLDDEAQPQIFSQFIGLVLLQVLPACKPQERWALVNRLIEVLAARDGLDYTLRRKLLDPPELLREVRHREMASPLTIPETSLSVSSLLTGAGDDPRLERELKIEMLSADRVDILVSFIKWSGLSLLMPAFEDHESRNVPARILTTSYMGASDPRTVEWLAARKGFQVRVSYDTERTRLHAKAYHFIRDTGFSTAYIGSANMSRPAMTSGLEWTVKVTGQDMPHILDRFEAEFETYWSGGEFTPYDADSPQQFRDAISRARTPQQSSVPRFYADLKPYPYQERILQALEAERENGSHKNLVVAATGTGKTIIAAFDYARFLRTTPDDSRLLFVAHRKEILQQARDCFRSVLRDFNFGELLVDGEIPSDWQHVFASVQSLSTQKPWQQLGEAHFDFLIIDEVHHGAAASYRALFDSLRPQITLGLTATPERMDGSSRLPEFNNRVAAESRLPEALEEKLLCPFHYFGVSDPVSVADECFWRNGRYDMSALEDVYTGDDRSARDRLNAVIQALNRYYPHQNHMRAVGFCAGVRHAEYMARRFRDAGFSAEAVLGSTDTQTRNERLTAFRAGKLQVLFVVDIFSEGIDIPEIDLVLFLRPTESLTVFLQQLGRGLRHAPEKDCLTVLDFVGQTHRKYRVDRKFSALLRTKRRRIDQEIELDFPNLPPGCNIQLERVAKSHILDNIRHSLGNLKAFVPEAIRSFETETGKPLNFGNFVEETALSPRDLLRSRTWSEWKDLASGTRTLGDPDLAETRKLMRRLSLRTDNTFLEKAKTAVASEVAEDVGAYGLSGAEGVALHYLFWGKKGSNVGVRDFRSSLDHLQQNPASVRDICEIIEWRQTVHAFPTREIQLPYRCDLRLHAAYGYREITAAFGKTSIQSSGPTGVGVIHVQELKTYLHFVTFRKEGKDFAPTTRYKDYPITAGRLHWESQAGTTRSSSTGQNYKNFRERGYTILFFARMEKKQEGETAPFLFLGPASALVSFESDRPIRTVWDLEYPMPAELFEQARAV
ncbi:MAG: DEAD/DEAH box helicase [Congregibacter sp.]